MPSIDLSIKQAKYIKLGGNGRWEDRCFGDGTIRLGYYEVPHELGLNGDKSAIRDLFRKLGKKKIDSAPNPRINSEYSTH